MAIRRWGPVNGAGVQIEEIPPDKQVTPHMLGTVAYVGVMEKGAIGELIAMPSKSSSDRKIGQFIDDSELPDTVADFWNLGDGAGYVWGVRVTDGNEQPSMITLYSRHIGKYFFNGRNADPTFNETPQPLMSLTAKNGGGWAGNIRYVQGDVAIVAADILALTIDTGISTVPINGGTRALYEDEWKGGTIELSGVPNTTYTIVSNTAAGIATVEAGNNMALDLSSGLDPTNAEFRVRVWDTYNKIAKVDKHIMPVIKDGLEDPSTYFGLEIWVDGTRYLNYENLSLDPNNKYYAEDVINKDISNYEIEASVLWTGLITPDTRPADFYGMVETLSGTTLSIDPFRVRSQSGSGDGVIGTFAKNANTVFLKRMRVECEMTTIGPGATFTVSVIDGEGAMTMDDLPNGTTAVAYSVPGPWGFDFTITDGVTPYAIGDKFLFEVMPFPVDNDGNGILDGSYLYPDEGSNPLQNYRIKDNTDTTIDFDVSPSYGAGAQRATFDFTPPVYPATIVLGVSDAFDITQADGTNVAGTVAAAAYADATTLAAALNAAWTIAGGTGSPFVGNVATGVITYTDPVTTLIGYDSSTLVVTIATNMYTVVGILPTYTLPYTVYGALGTEYRIQGGDTLKGGYDGIADISDTDYTNAFNTVTSPLNRLMDKGMGLVKIACPGITSTLVQKAGANYAEQKNYQYEYEIPSTVTTEEAAVTYINDTLGRNDFCVTIFPHYAYVPEPIDGQRLVLRTVTGAKHGREALTARTYEGYHKAAAGIEITLPNIVRLPDGLVDVKLNEELLNPQGINVIKKKHGNFVLWGDRTVSLDPGWKWKHQRELLTYYEHVLQEEFDWIIFAINDPTTDQEALTALRIFFLPEWRKRAVRGTTFEEAVSLKLDDSINTNLTRANGDVNCEIKLRLADTVERFKIKIGKAGIFEELGA